MSVAIIYTMKNELEECYAKVVDKRKLWLLIEEYRFINSYEYLNMT